MITSKQRAQLRATANGYDTIFQIGKSSEISENLVKQVNEALAVRELIKLRVLNNSEYTAKEAAAELAEKTASDVVQVIGTRFVLYKKQPNPAKRKILLG